MLELQLRGVGMRGMAVSGVRSMKLKDWVSSCVCQMKLFSNRVSTVVKQKQVSLWLLILLNQE